MKKTTKFFALLLALAMVLSSLQGIVFAENAETIIAIDNVYGSPEGTVDVDVRIENNPGILGAILSFTYDNDALTLVNAKAGEAFSKLVMSKPGKFVSPCQFAWDGESIKSEDIIEGIILTLTFKISENAIPGNDLGIDVSYSRGNIVDSDLNAVNPKVVSGVIQVIDYTPGDVDGDKIINAKDLVLIRRYITGGYDTVINEFAADVNDDGKINTTDLILIRRYLAGGYGVKLKPSHGLHEHNMTETAYKAPTCEAEGNIAYWYCDLCEEYFADVDAIKNITLDSTVLKAQGHNSIAFEAIPSTPTTEGYTAGLWCDKCETWTFGHEVIPPIAPNESNVSYRHYVQRENSNGVIEIVNDEYLSTHEIINPNPVTYIEGTGIAELIEGVEIDGKKVSANGYSFLGWYEKPETSAKRVYSISNEATGNKVLYGIWSKNEYKITYLPDSASSTLPRVEDGSYTVDKETSLKEPPNWPNLVWIGWSDEDGKIVKSIPKGTTGDISLTANWMSRRSQTVPNKKYSTTKPAIAIDEENGIYAFTYEIGDIQNVPIQQVEDGVDGKGFNLTKGQTHTISKTFTQKISSSEATSVADIIANATTKSDSWTLSEDWNKSTSFSQEHSSEVTQEQQQKAAMSFTETGKYTISAGVGGTKEHIDETGKSTKTTKKHELGVNYEVGTNINIGAKADLKAGVTKGTPFKNASVNAGASVDQKLGLDYKYTTETENTTHETHTDKTSSYWNLDEGFETSQSLSQTAEFAQSLSQSIRETYNYGETLDFGGSNSNTVSSSNTSSESREYASSVTYSQEEGSEITVSETFTAEADTGFYRKVLAANFKVFAVVIYDMKSNTFSTMTYSLKINDSEHLFTDYSTVSSFNDYENGVLPFEVPAFVGDYVYGLVGASEGLRFDDETGVIEGYGFKDPATGICYKEYDELTNTYSNPCDTDVIIPRYVVITVGGNQKKIVPVTGIAASAFSGTNVTSVYLSDRITVIPDGAFENCTELKYVRGGTINTIGKNAFRNCTALFEFELPEIVTNLGVNAFEGVKALSVNVSKVSVLDAALASGVERLSLNLEKLADTIDGKKISTLNNIKYFNLTGGGKTFNNISIKSDANTVVLNNITLNNTVDVPLILTSKNVELGFTTINANGLIMRLDADTTVITLDGNNYLTSSGDNAILSKDLRFVEKEDSSAAGKVRVTGNILVYGVANGTQRVTFENEAYDFVYLSQEEYENMLNSHYIYFDANGGSVDTDSKLVLWNSKLGELPVPTRDYHNFVGWFTEPDGNGTQITSDYVFNTLDDMTVYAHWTLKEASDWVLESEMPEGAELVSEKWTYNLREYTENNNSPSLTDWTHYDTQRTSWGAWSGWSTWNPSNGERNVEYRSVYDHTVYNYYRWTNSRHSAIYTYPTNSYDCTVLETATFNYELPSSSFGSPIKYNGTDNWANRWVPVDYSDNVSNNYTSDKTFRRDIYRDEWRYQDPIYTYYFYRDLSKEATSDPTGQANVSNVVKYVQYREK